MSCRQRVLPVLALLLGVQGAAVAQEAAVAPAWRLHASVGGLVAQPVGEFEDYVGMGGGFAGQVVYAPLLGGALGVRLEGGFATYGHESRRVCFSATVGCRVVLDLSTSNNIVFVQAGPRLMRPSGALRPYLDATIGFSYFVTESSLDDADGPGGDDIASTTNFDDVTFSGVFGGGVRMALPFTIPSQHGPVETALELGVRYHRNGRVEYLREGDIEDLPDGSIVLHPTRSEADFVSYLIGFSVGLPIGRGGPE